jgi:uncharacterized protein (DUF2252 family)
VFHVTRELERLDAPWAEGRPDLIRAKHARMREGSVPFFRATAPLWFLRLREELARSGPALEPLARFLGGDGSVSPRTSWCAGDVHVENFGAYRSPDHELRFGLNDFDDAVVAPVDLDVLRLASSFLVAGRDGGVGGRDSVTLARQLVEHYVRRVTALDGGDDPVVAEVPAGAPRDLLAMASEGTREKFLDRRAPLVDGRRRFVESERYHVLAADERARVLASFARAVAPFVEKRPGYYEAHDAARRTAGLGSLGAGRYAVIVDGKSHGKDPRENVLLEMKEARPASIGRHGPAPQPAFEDDADRVVNGQVALRGERQPHLGRTTLDGRSYYVRRLSHREQRVNLDEMGSHLATLGPLVEAEALALARAHVRARRSLDATPLQVPSSLTEEWLGLACRLAGLVESDYLAFCAGV